jgi:VIT1/CCC1 family predicted Fe2+/Mn2+ transporter
MPARRMLDPLERTLEILFGVIMVVVYTASLSITGSAEDVHEILIAAIGCNLAWGVVDAVMYLMATFAERSRGLTMLRAIRTASEPRAAYGLIADVLPAGLSRMLSAYEYEAVRQRLTSIEDTPRVGLGRDDYLGAAGIFALVFLSTFPVVIPFVVMDDLRPATRMSQLVAAIMLFAMGWKLGVHAGRPAWRTGLFMVTIGVVLSVLTFVLGG